MINNNGDEKYKATLLWNNIIRTFRSQIPLKTHRKNFKSYESTFTGCEAVDWLHGYLCAKADNPEKISRNQSLILLKKFHDHGLFCEANKKEKLFDNCSIKNDGTIYRFNNVPANDIASTPIALKMVKTTTDRNICPVDKIKFQLEEESKSARLNQPITHLSQILKPKSSGTNSSLALNANIENVWSKNLLNSLRSLLQWPVIDSVLDTSTVNEKYIAFNAQNFTTRGVAKVQKMQDELPHWVLQAMKCLANWPWYNNSLNLSCYEDFERDVFSTVLEFYISQASPLIPNDFSELFVSTLNRLEFLDVCQWDQFYCRNEQTTDEQKIVNQQLDEADLTMIFDQNNDVNEQENTLDDLSDLNIDCILPPCNDPNSAPDDQIMSDFDDNYFIRTQSYSEKRSRRIFLEKTSKNRAGAFLDNHKQSSILPKQFLLAKCRASFSHSSSSTTHNRKTLEDLLNSLPGLIKSPEVLSRAKATKLDEMRGEDNVFSESSTPADTKTFTFPSSQYPQEDTAVSHSIDFFTKNGRETSLEAMRLCLLLLPPKNRRWLQLLLRLMDKISINFCLKLDKIGRSSNRAILLESFCDSLFCANHLKFAKKQSLKLLNFFLDFHQQLFAVPNELIAI
uniref:DEP domain-containing protein n=1 Tax=Romanomermis culicivorax TaxID=13658 RepID=A0A915HNE9_ROMCU